MLSRFYKKYRLFVIAFTLAALAQGCNFNCSVGTPTKISETEAETLATKTLQNFNRSVMRGDFAEFHQTEVAQSVKNDFTIETINQAFAQFVTRRVDIRPRDGAKMSWSPSPAIDGQFLNLNGSYPAQTGKTVNFKLQYVRESNDWKLRYIDIKIP